MLNFHYGDYPHRDIYGTTCASPGSNKILTIRNTLHHNNVPEQFLLICYMSEYENQV